MSDETQDQGARSLMDRLVHAIGGEPRDREELLELLRDAQAVSYTHLTLPTKRIV